MITVDSIVVRGNERMPDLGIIGTTGLVPGNSYTIFDLQRAQKRLFATGQFSDIQTFAEGVVGGRVTVIFEVEERSLIRQVRVNGLESISPGSIQDSTDLRPGRALSLAGLAEAKRLIREDLADRGIPFASIIESVEPVEGRSKEIILTLTVEEGNRITVAEVEFEGNQVFTDDQLRGAMRLKPEGFWWWRSGSYDQGTLDEDLAVGLPGFYASKGYLDFRVTGDTLVIDPNTGKTRLKVTVDEGDQYVLGDFTVVGNSEFATEELEVYFRPESGGLLSSLGGNDDDRPYFDQVAFQTATESVNALYKNEGFLYSQIIPSVVRDERVEGEPPSVSVSWRIVEGNPAFINRVDIEGNEYTHERVIRDKIFILPGDSYSQDRVLQSYQSISSLGYFEVPLEIPGIVPTETGDVDVTFHVREQPTGSVNFGTSVGGGTGLSGFIGYTQPNLFGQGKSGSFRWDFGRFANNLTLQYSDPSLFESLVSGSVSLFNSRDRFITFRSGRRQRLGASFQLGFPVPGARFTRLFVGYGISRTKFTIRSGSDDTSLFGRPPGTQSTLTLNLTRTTLNHPIFPTGGSRQSLNFEFNGGPLGGDGDFVKTLAEGQWWVPIGSTGGNDPLGGQGIRFAAGLKLRAGTVNGDVDRFPFERFWMGGVQFGEQLRGYDETTVTPLGFFPDNSTAILDIDRLGNSFLLVSTEVAARVSAQLSASIFYDAGNVWRNANEFDPSKLFRGAGFGLQLVTPFGPVGLDYAYGFDKPVPGWQLHFRLGPGF